MTMQAGFRATPVKMAALLLWSTACGSSEVDSRTSGDSGTSHVPVGPSPHCPANVKGALLVHGDFGALGAFCIDSTETTNAQYRAFVDSSPATDPADPLCAWNTSFVPASK